jgi:hypothetical protein
MASVIGDKWKSHMLILFFCSGFCKRRVGHKLSVWYKETNRNSATVDQPIIYFLREREHKINIPDIVLEYVLLPLLYFSLLLPSVIL